MSHRIALVTLVVVGIVHAQQPDEPIPQGTVKQQAARKARLEYMRSLTVNAYDAGGKKSPEWDESVRTALEAYARHLAQPHGMLVDEQDAVIARATDAALAKGCTDPLVKYLATWHQDRFIADGRAGNGMPAYVDATLALARDSTYPPLLRLDAALDAVRTVRHSGRPGFEAHLSRPLAAALELIEPAVTDGDRPQAELVLRNFERFNLLANYFRAGALAPLRRKFSEAAETLEADRPLRHLMDGVSRIEFAWSLRGSGRANTVGAEQGKKFQGVLRTAVAPLEAAWKIDPDDATAGVNLLQIARGLGQPRAEMEATFRRALAADGDSYEACAAKLEYLLPRWHGAAETARAFALQCAETENWDAGLPNLLLHCHELLRDKTPYAEYYGRPKVRADVRRVYVPLLKDHPDAYQARTAYATKLLNYNLLDEAREQFDILGANVYKGGFKDEAQLIAVRKRVGAKTPDGPPKPRTPPKPPTD